MSSQSRLPYGAFGGASRVHVEGRGIRVTDLAGETRVAMGLIAEFTGPEGDPSGDYGLIVRNPAGTVVIDGTSQMFKIVASGTLSISLPAWSSGGNVSDTSEVALPGLGDFPLPPAHISIVTSSSSLTTGRKLGRSITQYTAPLFAPHTSGASPTNAFLALTAYGEILTYIDGGVARVQLVGFSTRSGVQTYDARYHILQEASI